MTDQSPLGSNEPNNAPFALFSPAIHYLYISSSIFHFIYFQLCCVRCNKNSRFWFAFDWEERQVTCVETEKKGTWKKCGMKCLIFFPCRIDDSLLFFGAQAKCSFTIRCYTVRTLKAIGNPVVPGCRRVMEHCAAPSPSLKWNCSFFDSGRISKIGPSTPAEENDDEEFTEAMIDSNNKDNYFDLPLVSC